MIDIVVVIIILVVSFILPQVNRTNFYNQEKLLISDFTIHVRNLKLDESKIYSEISEFVKHVENVLKNQPNFVKSEDEIIFDLNFPILSTEQLDLSYSINDKHIQILDMKRDGLSSDEETKIADLKNEIHDLQTKLYNSTNDKGEIEDVFITFHNQPFTKKFKELYLEVGKCKRNCNKCCGKNDYDYL
jgi:hypothetical protein